MGMVICNQKQTSIGCYDVVKMEKALNGNGYVIKGYTLDRVQILGVFTTEAAAKQIIKNLAKQQATFYIMPTEHYDMENRID